MISIFFGSTPQNAFSYQNKGNSIYTYTYTPYMAAFYGKLVAKHTLHLGKLR